MAAKKPLFVQSEIDKIQSGFDRDPISPTVGSGDAIIRDVRKIAHDADADVKEIQSGFGPKNGMPFYGFGGPGGWALDPEVWIEDVKRIERQLGRVGMIRFATEQAALWALSTPPKIYNAASPYLPPIARSMIPIAIDPAHPFFNVNSAVAPAESHAVAEMYNKPRPSYKVIENQTFINEHRADEWSVVDKYITDNIIDGVSVQQTLTETFGGVKRKRLDLSKSMTKKETGMEDYGRWDLVTKPIFKNKRYDLVFLDGVIPMEFPNEREDGSILTKGDQPPWDIIGDEDAYVPFSFTDLRPIAGNNSDSFRTIYMRPLLTSISENFSPQWTKEVYFGRTDQVVHYQATVRTINVSFQLHAFCPEDVRVIWNKLHWLASLTYPEYDAEMLLKSGPVCRMRIGELISSSKRKLGLPGIIDSLDYNFDDALWELKTNLKVPRSVTVSLSFNAIHDYVMGRTADGEFGGIYKGRNLAYVDMPGSNKEIQQNDPNVFRNVVKKGKF